MYHSVLSWPTIVVADTAPLSTLGAAVTAVSPRAEIDEPLVGVKGVTDSAALFIEVLLGACSTKVMMIAPPHDAWLSQDRLAKSLPPTLLRRLHFVDASAEQWARVLRYLEPVFDSILVEDREEVRQLAADLYQLCLGAQFGTEVDIDTPDDINLIDTLLDHPLIRGEARARLSVLRALFAGAHNLGDAVGVQAVPGSAAFVSDTLNDILDDAEFLQASALRRWFSASANKRAVSRDIRRVVNAVVRKNRWAKSLVTISTSLVGIAAGRIGGSNAARELADTIFDHAISPSVVIAPQPPVTGPSIVVRTVRAAKHDDEWCLWLRKVKAAPN